MDFKIVTQKLLAGFKKENIRYALMGGFALGLYGVGRFTADIDFIVHLDDLPKLDRIMADLGYELHFRTANVSQYISPLKVFGEVDFLHAFRPIGLGMLEQAKEQPVFSEDLKIKVLKPEDFIALKLQAIKNNPDRTFQDSSDIESLMSAHKSALDWGKLKEYYALFKMDQEYARLSKKHNK